VFFQTKEDFLHFTRMAKGQVIDLPVVDREFIEVLFSRFFNNKAPVFGPNGG
jgi:hypothetical protein